MRLSSEQVKQGLLHSDREIRSEAVYYFSRSYSRDSTVLPLAIQAIEQFGWEQAFESYTFLGDLVQTDATLLWFIGKLEGLENPANGNQVSIVSTCRKVLRHVDPALLLKHAAAIEDRITLDELTLEVNTERTRLLETPPDQFSTEAIEPARQYVLATPLDPDVLEVRSLLITACKLLDVRFPEFEAWLADSEHDRAFRKQWHADHFGAGSVDEMDATLDEWESEGDDDVLFDPELDDVKESATTLRGPPHVGRNEPCPCGSGKKYKKCCYRREEGVETDLANAAAIAALSYSEPPQFPIGTVALYGPDDETTTKIVASVIARKGAEPILKRFVGTRIAASPKVRRQIEEFFKEHRVKSVAATDSNLGCPHEEGEDFPVGEDCPFCPFWAGMQGSGQ
jgi:hypothetical protein